MRARYFEVALAPSGRPLPGVTVNVYQTGTTTPVAEALYADATSGTTLANPLTSNSQGEIEFYLASPSRVDLKWTVAGYTAETHPVDVIYSDFVPLAQRGVASGVATLDGSGLVPIGQLPGGAALDAEVAAAVAAEAVARDAAIAASEALSSGTFVAGTVRLTVDETAPSSPAVDDLWLDTDASPAEYSPIGHAHPGSYEPSGTVATHAGAADPHAGYTLKSQITASGKGYVNHGATAGTARPAGYASVEWFGSVEPTNWVDGDTWNDPS